MMDGLGRLAAASLASIVGGLADDGLCDCNHGAGEHKSLYGTAQKGLCERHTCACPGFRRTGAP